MVVSVAPPAMEPKSHVTIPLATGHVAWAEPADLNVTPAGNASVAETPVASPGPAFVTFSV